MKNLYEILGVAKDVACDALKSAFRKRAFETHPDRHPEKEEEFKDVALAYQVLSLPRTRKGYDDTGFVDAQSEEESIVRAAVDHIKLIFTTIVEVSEDKLFHIDVIQALVNKCDLVREKLSERGEATIAEINQWDEVKSHILFNGTGLNVMADVCDRKISALSAGIESIKHELKVTEKVREMLIDYVWEYESPSSFGDIGTTSPFARADW